MQLIYYNSFFVVPCLGVFIDIFGNGISLLVFCRIDVFISMSAAFGVYTFAYSFGPTTIIDSIRTSIWHSSVFGMNTIIRVITTGLIQDHDNDSYDNVTIEYMILAAGSILSVDLRHLQWTRKKRITRGEFINEHKRAFYEENDARNKLISMACFASLVALVLGSWVVYFWGVATGIRGTTEIEESCEKRG
ncbi:hypothetical protein V2W45_1521172 [Cenococcum geophilum]